ncbi:acyltransferase [Actinoplanes sp. TBRC 11911]|uniref:acyltransferase family protein n=1 Tax=Actinoplanes sp. TBRC 11911 TaxID=2729386 RepID=UPI00145F04A8|nr:acyltransferase [Actinoplanes sp. TBRC 11911]NMO53947.1 acyltransferase [Actinoplanes sp. TBRC 11911]
MSIVSAGRAARTGGVLESLTRLRWYAAFGVFCFHYANVVGIHDPAVRAALSLGYEGVPFFFVLSGFVLTWAHRPTDGVVRFLRNRFARVWPLVAVTAVVIALIDWSEGGPPSLLDLVYTLTLTQAWVPDHFYAVNEVTWTLSCEAFFYLVFPYVIRVLSRFRPWALIATAIVADAVTAGTRLLVGTHTMSPGLAKEVIASPLALTPMFVVGICAGLLAKNGARLPVGARTARLLSVAALAACWFWSQHPHLVPSPVAPAVGVYDALLVPFFALTIAALARRDATGTPGRVLFRRVLYRLGEASYAFYLVHVAVRDIWMRHWPFTGPGSALLPLLATVAVALLLHSLVEKPAQRLLKGRSSRTGRTAVPHQPTPPTAADREPGTGSDGERTVDLSAVAQPAVAHAREVGSAGPGGA